MANYVYAVENGANCTVHKIAPCPLEEYAEIHVTFFPDVPATNYLGAMGSPDTKWKLPHATFVKANGTKLHIFFNKVWDKYQPYSSDNKLMESTTAEAGVYAKLAADFVALGKLP